MKFWKDVEFMCMCICIQAYKSLEKLRRVSNYSQVKLNFILNQERIKGTGSEMTSLTLKFCEFHQSYF